MWVDDPHDEIEDPHHVLAWWVGILLEAHRYRALGSPPAGMPPRLIGTTHTPLPPSVTRVIELVQRDLARGKPVQAKHYAWLLDAIGEIVAWEDEGRARTVLRMLGPLNDRERKVRLKAFQPDLAPGERAETMSTERINLLVDAVKWLDLHVGKAKRGTGATELAAIRQVLELVQRREVDVTLSKLRECRRNLRRQTGRKNALPKAAYQRYAASLPEEAGATPESQAAWLWARLTRDTEP